MSTATFALLVFTLNEIDGMKQIMPRIQREWVDEIFIVDGGSTDGTVDPSPTMSFPGRKTQKPSSLCMMIGRKCFSFSI